MTDLLLKRVTNLRAGGEGIVTDITLTPDGIKQYWIDWDQGSQLAGIKQYWINGDSGRNRSV